MPQPLETLPTAYAMRPALADDLEALVPYVLQADSKNVLNGNPDTAKDLLNSSYRLASHAFSMIDGEGEPVVMAYAIPGHPSTKRGVLSLLGSTDVDFTDPAVIRLLKTCMGEAVEDYTSFVAFALASDAPQNKLLSSLGFDPFDVELKGEQFEGMNVYLWSAS